MGRAAAAKRTKVAEPALVRSHSELGVGETNMVAKSYLILGLGCVSVATSLAASATRPVEPQQKEAQVAERLNKRRMQS